jgi:GTP cyclohydrolase I
VDVKRIEKAVRDILEAIGEDPEREGLKETPKRVARMYQDIFGGLDWDARKTIKIFHGEEHEEMVMLRDIPFYSMCEHHLMPFFGVAHVAYTPVRGRLCGLSKLARVVEGLARRPQLQERLTGMVADTMMEVLKPHGVMVMVEAEHLCMTMRGVRKPGSKMVTSAVRGSFKKEATRAEALALISKFRVA